MFVMNLGFISHLENKGCYTRCLISLSPTVSIKESFKAQTCKAKVQWFTTKGGYRLSTVGPSYQGGNTEKWKAKLCVLSDKEQRA